MSFTANIDDVVAENRNHLLGKHPKWGRVRLKEVATILNGYPFESARFKKEGGTPLIRIRDILDGRTETFYDGEFDSTFLVKRGEILVGMDGDFHCEPWAGDPALLNQRVCKITPDETRYAKQFLRYLLPGYLSAINAQTPSVTVKHLSSRTIADIPLPLPPLPEQRRIVAEIEKQFTRLEAGVAALRRVQANLKRYRAALLKAACEGELTRDWRESNQAKLPSAEEHLQEIVKRREESYQESLRKWESIAAASNNLVKVGRQQRKPTKPARIVPLQSPELPSGWLYLNIASLCEIEDGDRGSAYPKKDDFTESGYCLFLNTKNVRPDGFDFTSNQFISRVKHEALRKGTLERGDVVFTSRGTLGNIAHYSADVPYDVMRINSGMFILRNFEHAMSQRFLAHLLRSPQIKAQISDLQSGSAQPQLPIGDFREFKAAVPPLSEQTRIVAEVERRLSVVEELESVVSANLQRATRLRQSILQKAFTGEL